MEENLSLHHFFHRSSHSLQMERKKEKSVSKIVLNLDSKNSKNRILSSWTSSTPPPENSPDNNPDRRNVRTDLLIGLSRYRQSVERHECDKPFVKLAHVSTS